METYRKSQPLNKELIIQVYQKGVSMETMETYLDPPLIPVYVVLVKPGTQP